MISLSPWQAWRKRISQIYSLSDFNSSNNLPESLSSLENKNISDISTLWSKSIISSPGVLVKLGEQAPLRYINSLDLKHHIISWRPCQAWRTSISPIYPLSDLNTSYNLLEFLSSLENKHLSDISTLWSKSIISSPGVLVKLGEQVSLQNIYSPV